MTMTIPRINTTPDPSPILMSSLRYIVAGIVLLLALVCAWPHTAIPLDLLHKNLPPSPEHWFGTDWLGRDMLARSLSALLVSLKIGLSAVLSSSLLAVVLATCALCHSRVRYGINLLIDVLMSLPHLLLLLLLSLCFGGNEYGLFMALTLSHWPKNCRLLIAEMLAIRQMPFFQLAQQFGQSRVQVIGRHMLPHILPQWLTAILLLFPHALTHMASLTFLGFGLDPQQPSIGGLLSEASRYLLTGHWWLALCPGILLISCIGLFSYLAHRINQRVRLSTRGQSCSR